MKNSIVWVLVLCFSGCIDQEKKGVENLVKFSTWIDSINVINEVESLTILFSSGFDVEEDVKVFINNEKIGDLQCETDYSTGYCLDKESKLVSLEVDQSILKVGDTLLLNVNNYNNAIIIPSGINKYNRLVIWKDKDNLGASFERTGETLILE